MSKVNFLRLAIAVPTYNESKNLPKLINKVRLVADSMPNVVCTLLVIDDNSPDGTSKIAKELSKNKKTKNFQIKILDRKTKEGLGKAYIAGFRNLLNERQYDYILQMDADLSHNPKYIPDFIDAVKSADFIVGSRYIKGGSTPDWSMARKSLSRWGNIYTCLFLGTKIHDYTGGYNLYSTKLLNKIDLNNVQTSGYGFLIELKYTASHYAHSIKEIPIIFIDRQHGTSKIPKNTLINNLLLVPYLRFKKSNR